MYVCKLNILHRPKVGIIHIFHFLNFNCLFSLFFPHVKNMNEVEFRFADQQSPTNTVVQMTGSMPVRYCIILHNNNALHAVQFCTIPVG